MSVEDQIVDKAAEHDQLISEAARDLIVKVISEMDAILEHGTPAAKQQVLRAFVAPLLRTATERKDTDALAEMRKEFQKFQGKVLGYEGGTPPEKESDSPIDEDTPPDE